LERITSRQNPLVQNLAGLADDARRRRSQSLCLLEGIKLVREAVRLGYRLDCLCLSERLHEQQPGLPFELPSDRTVLITEPVLRRISTQPSPDGVVATVQLPQTGEWDPGSVSRLVMISGLQDPVNVGAVVRTAAALGYEGVLTDAACADPFSPRALRASMGASLTLIPLRCDDLAAVADSLRRAGHLVVAGSASPGGLDAAALAQTDRMTVVIGSEGNGIAPDLLQRCDEVVRIPITNKVESLNAAAAAAILMWQFRPELR